MPSDTQAGTTQTTAAAQKTAATDAAPDATAALQTAPEAGGGEITAEFHADRRQYRRIVRKANRSIFQAFIAAKRRKGARAVAVIDGDGRKLTYGDLAKAAFALSGPIARMTAPGEKIGVLLPTGAGALIALFAIHAAGRVPAMLNFTSGVKNIKAASKAAEVTKVVTAHKFIDIARLQGLVDELEDALEFHYLEDMRESLALKDKLRAVVGPLAPKFFAARPAAERPGVILFTSGTEGAPKGVVLSHANILANIEQIAEHVEIAPSDIFFNPLPTFHCYGLTAGALWPVLVGYPVAFHPSPLQTKIIPKRIFETNATVLFATDTFLQQYMRASDAGGMSSLRIAVCGAERVKDETRAMATRKFAFQVLEGYGVTETAPVLAANQPGDIRSGTVGRMLPAVDWKLEKVPGLEDAGRLFVRGPNVMQGYITADAPGEVKPPPGGWHDTGDIVSVDKRGYITIRGRVKRFAKIGGEMVSLAVVEHCATAVWPDNMHAATIMPDPKKGEQIVLVTDYAEPDRSLLIAWARSHGVPEIAIPRRIVSVDAVPVLGTGKLDYVAVQRLAEAKIAEEDAARAERKAEEARRAASEKNRKGGKKKKAADNDAGGENDLPKAAE